MDLKDLNFNESESLATLSNTDFDTTPFYRIIEVIKIGLKKININPKDLYVYYQRQFDGTSILAIQLIRGDCLDTKNFMFNGCQVFYYGDVLNCDVYLHANAKCAQNANKLSGLISHDIVSFFESVENDLLKKNLKDVSIAINMPIEQVKEKEQGSIKKLIRTFFTN